MSKQDKVKAPGLSVAAPVSLVSPLATTASPAPAPGALTLQAVPPAEPVIAPAPVAPVIPEDVQRRLVDLSVERETLVVRLEEATRGRADLEARLVELQARLTDLQARQDEIGTARSHADAAVATLTSERDTLARQVSDLQDEVLRLPEELKALQNSRAFKIMKAGPFLAMRQPLSTLLIVAGMGVATGLWNFTPLADSIYVGVGALVLLVSAIQFWARND